MNEIIYSRWCRLHWCYYFSGKDFKVIESPKRKGDPARLIASSKKAEEILGWKAEIDLEEIIRSAWNWHLNLKNQTK